MKKFGIDWETDYCEDFPENSGTAYITAETEEEAISKFYAHKPDLKAMVMGIWECKE